MPFKILESELGWFMVFSIATLSFKFLRFLKSVTIHLLSKLFSLYPSQNKMVENDCWTNMYFGYIYFFDLKSLFYLIALLANACVGTGVAMSNAYRGQARVLAPLTWSKSWTGQGQSQLSLGESQSNKTCVPFGTLWEENPCSRPEDSSCGGVEMTTWHKVVRQRVWGSSPCWFPMVWTWGNSFRSSCMSPVGNMESRWEMQVRGIPLWPPWVRGKVTRCRACKVGCLLQGQAECMSQTDDPWHQESWAESFGGGSGRGIIAWPQLFQENRPQITSETKDFNSGYKQDPRRPAPPALLRKSFKLFPPGDAILGRGGGGEPLSLRNSRDGLNLQSDYWPERDI